MIVTPGHGMVLAVLALLVWTVHALCRLRNIPGPLIFALTKWRLSWEDWTGARTRTIHRLHREYGPVVRIGPNEVSFNSVTALRQIYASASGFGRGDFYRMFDVYGRQHLFTFYPAAAHSKRKRVLSQLYSKSAILKGPVAASIQSKVRQYLRLIESDPQQAGQLVQSLHYYALDNITWMVYGENGATAALAGRALDTAILDDMHQPTGRRLSWFQVHLPGYSQWAMSRGERIRGVLRWAGILPGETPVAYSGLQGYARNAFTRCRTEPKTGSIVGKLLAEQAAGGADALTDLDIAAECADHLDAGLKTTSDTLMFAVWALSLPENQGLQHRLAMEVASLTEFDAEGIPTVEVCDRLPFLDAVVKETLRLYAPIPASQPRTSPHDVMVDGYPIPAGTVVSCQAYSLHRNPDVFRNPSTFQPGRWLEADEGLLAEMKRLWWPFSSGARMCLGSHLAIAEMKTLLAAVYQRYSTTLSPGWEGRSPAITSRFELVFDDFFSADREQGCYVEFHTR